MSKSQGYQRVKLQSITTTDLIGELRRRYEYDLQTRDDIFNDARREALEALWHFEDQHAGIIR